jgi:hypothetical protein
MLPDDCRLLIVDNLSAWTSSAREDGTAFAPIKRWLAHLRTKGVAVLLVHHTGKNGSSQRGTSIHEDLLDYSILLREDKSGKPKNGTSFVSVRQSHLEPERDTKDARVRVTSLRTHEHFGNRVAKQADTAAACAGVQGKSGAGMPSAWRVDCGRRAGQRPEREHGSQVGD